MKALSILANESTARFLQSVAIVLAGSWAIYMFVWGEFLRPMFFERPLLKVSSDIVESGRNGRHVSLKLTATAENPGQAEAHILAAWFKVVGVRVAPTEKRATECGSTHTISLSRNLRSLRCEYFAPESRPSTGSSDVSGNLPHRGEVLAVGKLTDQAQRWRVPHGVSYTRVAIVHVPVGYDYVRLEVEFRYARSPSAVRVGWRAVVDGSWDEVLTKANGEVLDLASSDPSVQRSVNDYLLRNYVLKTFATSELSFWEKPVSGHRP